MSAEQSLLIIKIVHTAVWVVMATAIISIPFFAVRTQFRSAAWLSALIAVECLVLAINHGRCPLTDMAARFTPDRSANFDICLPGWLAEHNKEIFGGLFVVSELIFLWQWIQHQSAKKNGATRR